MQDKCQLGIEQLNRYAVHLKQNNRLVEYGFVYMFFHNKNNEEERLNVEKSIKEYIASQSLSTEFHSIYRNLIFNNVALWGTKP